MANDASTLDTAHPSPDEAFQQLARIALSEHSLDTVMDLIADLARRTVPGVSEVSVTLVANGRPSTIATTGPLAQQLDERQYARGYGPCLDGITAGEVVRIDSMGADQRWADWAREAAAAGVGSSLSVPVPLQREVAAALNLYGLGEHAFDEASVQLAVSFAGYAGVALANMHLYEAQTAVARQLQEAMRSRAVIEQAKGILMGQRRCSAEEAFGLLVKLSQDANRKLRDVAQALVDEAEKPA